MNVVRGCSKGLFRLLAVLTLSLVAAHTAGCGRGLPLGASTPQDRFPIWQGEVIIAPDGYPALARALGAFGKENGFQVRVNKVYAPDDPGGRIFQLMGPQIDIVVINPFEKHRYRVDMYESETGTGPPNAVEVANKLSRALSEGGAGTLILRKAVQPAPPTPAH